MDTLPDNSPLPYTHVDPHSPVPLYHQIYLDLRGMIQNGILASGDMLPPEMEICQAYSVGRQTVRQAIAHLVDEDLVERYAGRGTFVRAQHAHTQFLLDRSFTQQMREMGRIARTQLLRCESDLVDGKKSPALQPWHGSPCLVLERLRLGDDEPVCQQTSVIPLQRVPGLEQIDFHTQSLYEVITTRYNLVINRIDHVVRAVAADEYRAELLDVPAGTPLLFVATTAYTDDGNPIESSTSYYRADRYEYSTTQTCCNA